MRKLKQVLKEIDRVYAAAKVELLSRDRTFDGSFEMWGERIYKPLGTYMGNVCGIEYDFPDDFDTVDDIPITGKDALHLLEEGTVHEYSIGKLCREAEEILRSDPNVVKYDEGAPTVTVTKRGQSNDYRLRGCAAGNFYGVDDWGGYHHDLHPDRDELLDLIRYAVEKDLA